MSNTEKFRHEINNYLSVIYSEMQSIEEKYQILANDHDWLTMKQDTWQLGKIVNSIDNSNDSKLPNTSLENSNLPEISATSLEDSTAFWESSLPSEDSSAFWKSSLPSEGSSVFLESSMISETLAASLESSMISEIPENFMKAHKYRDLSELFSIHNLLQSLSHSWKLRYSQKGLRLTYINQNQESLKMRGTPFEIIQIFNNLLSNSYDSLTEKQQKRALEQTWFPEATLILTAYKDQIIIKLSDNGCGIPDNKLPHIFEDGFTTKNSGHGIGLAVVKELVKKHHGHIYVHSQESIGCDFYLIFPAVEDN